MKVLHVLASNKFSGAENVACQIIDLFKIDSEIEMAYCSVDGPIRTSLSEKDISFFGMEKLTTKNLKKIIKIYQPDIIHAHDMKASVIAACSCKNIPIVSHIHNNSYFNRVISLKSIIYRIFANKFSHVFWVSNAALNNYVFKRSIKLKSSILYNNIDCEFIRNQVSSDVNFYDYDVLYLGRLEYPKNPLRFLNICKMVIKQNDHIKIGILGEGTKSKKIIKKCNKKPLKDKVVVLGHVKNPYKILSCAKALVITSRWEGMPIVALEAMALNIPIICTNINELVELVGDYHYGFICKNNNEFKVNILKILNNNIKICENDEKRFFISINNSQNLKSNVLNVYRNVKNF